MLCSVSAGVSGSGSLAAPQAGGSGRAGVKYRAGAQPLQIVLGGGIGPQSNKKYLIGQRVTATVQTGGLTATSYHWDEGSASFANYTADFNNGILTYLSRPLTDSSLSWYVSKPVPANRVECVMHLAVPAGALPVGGFDVSPNRSFGVEPPEFELHADIGWVKGDPSGAQNINKIHLFGGTLLNSNISGDGIYWWGTVSTPTLFNTQDGDSGDWGFTQLGRIGRSRIRFTTNGYETLHNSLYGVTGLDGDVFYRAPYATYQANSTQYHDHDTPSQGIAYASGDVRVAVSDSFRTYMMYRPPGQDSCYVPLKSLEWFWGGEAYINSSQWWQVDNTDSGWTLLGDFPDHPSWFNNVSGQGQSWVLVP